MKSNKSKPEKHVSKQSNKSKQPTAQIAQDFMAMLEDALCQSHISEDSTIDSDLLEIMEQRMRAEEEEDELQAFYDRFQQAESDEAAIAVLKEGKKKFKDNLEIQTALIRMEACSVDVYFHEMGKLIRRETKKLVTKGILPDETQLWYHWDCRPYMRMRYEYMMELSKSSHIRQAIEEAKWLLSVSQNDNLGVRYTLMALYAFYEEIDAAEALYAAFDKESSAMLRLPMAVMYYRNGDYKNAKKFVLQAERAMPELRSYLKTTLEGIDTYIMSIDEPTSYAPRSKDEYDLTIQNFKILYIMTPAFFGWAYGVLSE